MRTKSNRQSNNLKSRASFSGGREAESGAHDGLAILELGTYLDDLLDAYAQTYALLGFQAWEDHYGSEEEAVSAMIALGNEYVSFAKTKEFAAGELTVYKIQKIIDTYEWSRNVQGQSHKTDAMIELAARYTIEDTGQPLDLSSLVIHAKDSDVGKQTARQILHSVKSVKLPVKSVATTVVGLSIITATAAAADTPSDNNYSVENAAPSTSASVGDALSGDFIFTTTDPAVNADNVKDATVPKSLGGVVAPVETLRQSATGDAASDIAAHTSLGETSSVDIPVHATGLSPDEDTAKSDTFQMVTAQLPEDVLATLLIPSSETANNSEQISTHNETAVSEPENEYIKGLIDTLQQENVDRMLSDPRFANEAGSSNQHLLSVLDAAADNPAMFSMLSDEDREALLSSSYYGNPDLVIANMEGILEGHGSKQDYESWASNFDGTAEQKQLMVLTIATVQSSMMSKTEAELILNPDAKKIDVAITDPVNTVIPEISKPENSEDYSDLSDHEINLLAAQRLSDRGDNPKPNTVDWKHRGIAMKFFIDKGLTPIQAAGIIGNLVVESSDDSLPVGIKQFGGGPGRGIAQWEEAAGGSGRANQLYEFADYIGQPWDDIDTQLQFIWWEYENYPYLGLANMKNTETLAEASAAFMNDYERPAVRDNTPRLAGAEDTYEGFMEEQKRLKSEVEASKSNQSGSTTPESSQADRQAIIDDLARQGYTVETDNHAGRQEVVPEEHRHSYYWNQHSLFMNEDNLDASKDGTPMSVDGCGPTTLAMVASSLRGTSQGSTPLEIDSYLDAHSLKVKGVGMFHSAIPEVLASYGLDTIQLRELTMEEVTLAFENGAQYVTINSNPDKTNGKENVYKKSGHIFVIDGITADGKLLILDPADFQKTQKAWDPDMVLPYADASATFAVGNVGDLQEYSQVIADDKAEAEQLAKDKADKEREEQERKDREKAEQDEADRQESEKTNEPDYVRVVREATERQPDGMPSGIAIKEEVKANGNGLSGYIDQDELRQIPGMTERLTGDPVEVHKDVEPYFLAMNEAFKAEFGYDLPINDSYRSYADQVAVKNKMGEFAAQPGKSNHGYLAFDIQVGDRNSEIYKWIQANGGEWGFYNPKRYDPRYDEFYADDSKQIDEPWHVEFSGKDGHIAYLGN